MNMVAATPSSSSASTKGCCGFFSCNSTIPNPLRFLDWIKSFFINLSYSTTQLDALSKKKVKVLNSFDKMDVKTLEPFLDQFGLGVYQAWKKKQDSIIKAGIKKFISFFKEPDSGKKLMEFISGTASSTIINLLLNENPKKEDLELLEALMILIIPGTEEKPKHGFLHHLLHWWQTWWEGKTDSRVYASFNENLRKEIDAITQDTIIDPYKLAETTKYLNISDLLKTFNGDVPKLKIYLQKILTIMLNEKVDHLLKDSAATDKISEIIENIEPQLLGNDGLEQIIKSVSPLITKRCSEFLNAFFRNEYSITDRAMQVCLEHLAALSQARAKAENSSFDFTKEKVEALQKKMELNIPLDKMENKVKNVIWGDQSYQEALNAAKLRFILNEKPTGDLLQKLEILQKKMVSQTQLTAVELELRNRVWEANFYQKYLASIKDKFLNETPEPLVFAYFCKEEGAAPIFKDETKQISLESGELLFGLFDQFFTDTLLLEIVDQLTKNRIVGLFIKNQQDVDQAKSLFPFLKQVFFRNVFAHLMQGDTPEQGWYFQITQFLSKEGMSRLLSERVLPIIKENFLESLVEKVLKDDPALLDKIGGDGEERDRIQLIFEACVNVHENINESFKKNIEQIVQKYDAFMIDSPPLNPAQQKQSVQLFFEPVNSGEYLETYAAITKLLLFDFGGLPGWLKWILGFFDGLISHYLTSVMYPYRKSPETIAKIIHRKIQENFSTPKQLDALFADTIESISVPSVEESVEDIAKLIFATSTYKASNIKWAFLRVTLGSEGSLISSIFKNVIHNSVMQGSEINMSLIFRLSKLLLEKSKTVNHTVQEGVLETNIDDRWWKEIIGRTN